MASKPDFKIFVACENQAALYQARQVRDQVESLCKEEFEVSTAFWNFALFRSGSLRARAVLEAADAEVIVISLGGDNDLPEHAQAWMESLPVRREAGQAVLVAVIAGEEEPTMRQRSQIAYLREIATSRGLEFLCNHAAAEPADIFTPSSFLSERVESWRGNDLEMSWNIGGINE
jgi:hypothetical protein